MHTAYERKLLMLKPTEITLPLKYPHESKDSSYIKALAKSIKNIGIVTPLSVRKNENGKYELISGEYRLKASVIAGIRRVPCVCFKIEAKEASVLALADNLTRLSPDFFQEAEMIKYIIKKHRISQSDLAHYLGISENTLLEKIRVLRLNDDDRQKIYDFSLTESHVRSLLRLPPEKRENALDNIINQNLDNMKAEEYISKLLSNETKALKNEEKAHIPLRKTAIGDIRLFSNSLSKLTQTLNNSGIEAYIRRNENERYIEYKVRIKKEEKPKISAEQLKIC